MRMKKVLKLYSYRLISHENMLLIEHLKSVGDRMVKLMGNKKLNFNYSKEILEKVAKVIGYCHDLAKATEYFQKYINENILYGKSSIDDRLKSHGSLSAIICYSNLKEVNTELALISYLVIKHHHGDLNNFEDDAGINMEELKSQKKILKKQYESLQKEIFNIGEELNIQIPICDEILDEIEDINDKLDDYNLELMDNLQIEKYILFKYIFSLLIYSDKEHAIFKDTIDITYDLHSNLIDEYKLYKFGENNIPNIRNVVYDDITKAVDKRISRIMSITVPTGTGKTLASMSVALKVKEILNEDLKIIYCLPFTSVIDQNFTEYESALKLFKGKDISSNEIIKHHYLSPKSYKKSEFYYENNEGRFLTESWNSQIVVTTFIQFFDTIFSNSNSKLIKYNNISNSIVLLDEVQSIPYRYWQIINRLFKVLAETLNIYFVFITATQPLIFSQKEVYELATKSEEYFKSFKRTKLIVKEELLEKDEFFSFIKDIIKNNQNKNILVIVNTIKLSQELFKTVEKYIDKNDEIDLIYLSTSIVPKARKERIEYIKTSKKRKIVISTQMVEAGVDIDMDIVIRDIAPLDSINQSAGRANRENRGEYLGEVYIVKVVNNGKRLAEYVYKDKILLQATEKVLKGKDVIYEEEYKELNDKYFKEVKNTMTTNNSKKLENMILNLRFSSVDKEFRLIENQEKISVFIELNHEAVEIWNKYNEYKKIKDRYERKNKLESIKGDFYKYVISVFKNKFKEELQEDIAYISNNQLQSTYDYNVGYKIEEDNSYIL
ncbi:CRISPR-associated helicase Cas3' [uncultured Clostridium sp.]|uniref:CRISPR-associated helicase Cas3' n=1 Tax=uncultured Clostridium sp. TaxID=59620 RepID=UPI002639E0CE|nr:CRISPR-associated helicase Cas3' [uncultured Clostridium sp.]